MPVNLTKPRPDMVYLRRRLKRGETTAPAETSKVSTATLTLSSNKSSTSMIQEDQPSLSALIPNAVGLPFLQEPNDAYRLNKRQSAIGSLVISNAMVVGWQMQDGSSGYIYNEVAATEYPETKPPEFNKKPFIEFHNGLLTMGLRNIKHLKRLIIVPKNGETIQAETLGGTGAVIEYEPFTVLYISLIDSVLELRKEYFRNTLTETFNLHTVKPHNAKPDTSPLRTLFS